MKTGSLVKLIPDVTTHDPFVMLWDSPPNFTTIYMKNHVGKFHINDTGLVLEEKMVLESMIIPVEYWSLISCPGGIGWVRRSYLEMIK